MAFFVECEDTAKKTFSAPGTQRTVIVIADWRRAWRRNLRQKGTRNEGYLFF